MGLLGPNAHSELLQPGRVPDCYLGLLLGPDAPDQAPGVLVVSPAALLHPAVPQPGGMLVYELVTGHPDRQPQELVFLADLTVELRAWPADTLERARGRPAGGRPRGGGWLAARRPAGPATGRVDRGGGRPRCCGPDVALALCGPASIDLGLSRQEGAMSSNRR